MIFPQSYRSVALLAALPLALAQTSTSCNPLTATCSADTGLASSSLTTDFTSSGYSDWTVASGYTLTQGSDGLEFIITKDGQAPTITSDFYIFFGRVDVVMQAAAGTGIVSSIVLESDDLDEIDWEMLGGDTTQAQTNFFGKGNTTTYDRGSYESVSNPQTTFHTYSVDWTSSRIEWLIDDVVVRTVAYSSALALEGANYPQTPAVIKIGNWVGGGSSDSAGTVEWAGGETDFSKAPFTMYVKSVKVTNYNPAASYSYGDHTGDYDSIKISGAVSGSSSSSTNAATTSTTTTSVKTTSSSTVDADKTASSATLTTITATTTAASTVTSATTSSGFVSSSKTSSSTTATYTGSAAQTTNSAGAMLSVAGSLLALAAAFII